MPQIKADEISKIIRQQIENFETAMNVSEIGSVLSVGDGIARIYGLERVMAGEMVELPHGVTGIAMNLEEDQVGAVLLGDYTAIKEGDLAKRTGKQVRMTFSLDPTLIGGLMARIGSTIYDGSVRGQLERLRAGLLAG